MKDVSFNQASLAYRDATRIAEKIVSEVADGEATPVQNSGAAMRPSFDDVLSNGMDRARDAGYKSEAVSANSLANQANLNDLIGAVSNAELTLNTVVAVRDKIINAYQDIIKMPI